MSSKLKSKTVPDVRLGLWDEGKNMPRKMNFFHMKSTAIYGTMAYWTSNMHLTLGITKSKNKNIYFIAVYEGIIQQYCISKCFPLD